MPKEMIRDQDIKELILENLYYDESSPTCLRWKTEHDHFNLNRIGKKAGTDSKNKSYTEVYIKGFRLGVHRAVMILKGEDIEGKFVDHINGDVFDNRYENLRAVDLAGNQRNRKISNLNSSGIAGIRRCAMKNGSSTKINHYYEAAYYNSKGKLNRKKFNIEKLGEDVALNLAIEFRKNGILNTNEELIAKGEIPYTERHLINLI